MICKYANVGTYRHIKFKLNLIKIKEEKENKSSDDYVQVSVADLDYTLPVVDFGKCISYR